MDDRTERYLDEMLGVAVLVPHANSPMRQPPSSSSHRTASTYGKKAQTVSFF